MLRWRKGNPMTRITKAALLMVGLALAAGQAAAADIKVLSTGNMANILADLTGEFERTSGHKLIIETGSIVRVRERIEAGEAGDLAITERPILEALAKQGRIVGGTIVDIARSPLGVAVRAGAPKPDISTTEGFKNAFLKAASIAVPNPANGAQDGIYFVELVARLGIAAELLPKIKLTQGGDNAAQLVASGGVEIGIAQRRNFHTLSSVALLEPLPDIPGIKFAMAAGIPATARERDGAMAFAKFLSSAAVATVIRTRGMEPYVQ
jgi:molybdate transport system substrate-binding protein